MEKRLSKKQDDILESQQETERLYKRILREKQQTRKIRIKIQWTRLAITAIKLIVVIILLFLFLRFMGMEIQVAHAAQEVRSREMVSMQQDETPLVQQAAPAYYDVPLSQEFQNYLFSKCAEYNIAPALVLAVMEKESGFDASKIGDDGASVGLMQINGQHHKERMERLGIVNLMDPYQNAAVGIDYLAEALRKNPEGVYYALMYYNGGPSYAENKMQQGKYSEYAMEVSQRAAELQEEYDHPRPEIEPRKMLTSSP